MLAVSPLKCLLQLCIHKAWFLNHAWTLNVITGHYCTACWRQQWNLLSQACKINIYYCRQGIKNIWSHDPHQAQAQPYTIPFFLLHNSIFTFHFSHIKATNQKFILIAIVGFISVLPSSILTGITFSTNYYSISEEIADWLCIVSKHKWWWWGCGMKVAWVRDSMARSPYFLFIHPPMLKCYT